MKRQLLSVTVAVRITEAMNRELKSQAKRCGVTLGKVLRARLQASAGRRVLGLRAGQ